jgi:uncharacterized membrane protein (DUF106 family)
MTQYPKESVVILACAITFALTLVTKYTTDQKRMKEIRDIQKSHQLKMKEAQKEKDNKKMMDLQKEMMQYTMEMFKHSFKPMLITAVPMLILIVWVRDVYTPVLSSWFWYYFIGAIVSSIIFRKILKVV